MKIKLDTTDHYDINGWTSRPLLNKESEAHEKILVLKEHLMTQFCALLIENPRLKDLQQEYLKSSVRAIIRYSDEAKNFAKEVVSAILEINRNDSSISNLYITPPYLIFHQPSDAFEQSDFHIDTIPDCGKLLTWWTPINERQVSYAAITILQGSHKFLSRILLRLIKKFLPHLLYDRVLNFYFGGKKKYLLIPHRRSSYFWGSNLIHSGNQNTEDSPHCALVFKISTLPLFYEPSNTLIGVRDNKFVSHPSPSITDIYRNLLKMEEYAKTAPDLTLIDENFVTWVRSFFTMEICNSPILAKHICFALTLISQRFPQAKLSPAFNLMSFLLAKENLVGLERFLIMLNSKDKVKRVIEILMHELSMESYQENLLFKRFGIYLNLSKNNLKDKSMVLGWI